MYDLPILPHHHHHHQVWDGVQPFGGGQRAGYPSEEVLDRQNLAWLEKREMMGGCQMCLTPMLRCTYLASMQKPPGRGVHKAEWTEPDAGTPGAWVWSLSPLLPHATKCSPCLASRVLKFYGQGPVAGPTVLVFLCPRAETKFWTLQGIVSMDCD